MKEYTLKNSNNKILFIGVFSSEQQAWNVINIRAGRVADIAFLYCDDKLVYSDKVMNLYDIKNSLIEYELNISPNIYNIKVNFSRNTTVEEVWETTRKRAIDDGMHKTYIAHLTLDGKVLITNFLDQELTVATVVEEIVREVDLLFEISKIKI